MIELIQFPWSPYCLVQRRILEFGRIPHKIVNIPQSDRSRIWKLTRERYYHVPVLRDGRQVLFETGENSQVIAKYLDSTFNLNLFPERWAGLQNLIWRHVENDIEGLTFKLNDAQFKSFVPAVEQLAYRRHKERKFGRYCLEHWRDEQKQLTAELTELLVPYEQMLGHRSFLLEDCPRFVDFDLWGMLANFLYSGRYKLPTVHPKIKDWYGRMSRLKSPEAPRRTK
jgi:glutathione S-transferase